MTEEAVLDSLPPQLLSQARYLYLLLLGRPVSISFSAYTTPGFFFNHVIFHFSITVSKSLEMIRHLFMILLATLLHIHSHVPVIVLTGYLGMLLYFNLYVSSARCWVLFISSILQIKLRHRGYLICPRLCS